MRKALFLLMMSAGCAEEPEHNLGDAAREVAYSLCGRWIECEVAGMDPPITNYQKCVDDLVWDFCNRVLDLKIEDVSCIKTAYPDWSWDRLVRCTEFYSELSCGVYADNCTVEAVWP